MTCYFIEKNAISSETYESIQNWVFAFVLDGVPGFLVETDAEHVFRTLGMRVVDRGITDYQGIRRGRLVDASEQAAVQSAYSVQAFEWDGNMSVPWVIGAVETELSPSVGKNIFISVPHRNTVGIPEGDDCFYVYVWSSKRGNEDNPSPVPATLWGHTVSCRDKAYDSSGEGVTIVDPEHLDFEVAELIEGRVLFIHFDAVHCDTEDDRSIFVCILRETAKILRDCCEKVDAVNEARMRQSRIRYTHMCKGRLHMRNENAIIRAEKLRASIEQMQRDFCRLQRERASLLREIESFRELLQKEESVYGSEFDKLLQHPQIVRITVRGGVLFVFTTVLYCRDERTNKLHEIGKFRIKIDTGNCSVQWKNLDRQVRTYNDSPFHAPHINSDGTACLGNLEETVAELFASNEYLLLAVLAIRFVESANVEDAAGRFINRWPVASRDAMQEAVSS